MARSAFAGRVTAVLLLSALASGCGDGLITGQAGAAGIVVTMKPGGDAFALASDYLPADEGADAMGLVNAVAVDGQVVMAFSDDATGSQVGEVALRLARDERVSTIVVSVLDERGESVIRP